MEEKPVKVDLINIERKGKARTSLKLAKAYNDFELLISELRKKDIPPEVTEEINKETAALNAYEGSTRKLRKRIKKAEGRILELVARKLKLVPQQHYASHWIAFGSGIFGVPFGVGLWLYWGNIGYMVAIALPLGMLAGLIIGIRKDKEAYEEGRQLNLKSDRDPSGI